MIHLYSPNLYASISLENFVLNNKLVPRRLKDNERLKLYHRYWIEEYGSVKITDIFNFNHVEYYCIRYGDKLSGCIPEPVLSIVPLYELLRNDHNLESVKFGESDESYTGAEIRYWALHSRIELNSNNMEEINNMIENQSYHVKYNEASKKMKVSL